ncbi:hypothetical protein AAW00_00025 [Aurantiacibacter luteus]|uniref:Cell wall hydrolase SleB domain-containing protein n=2 Tax=Aurantiacibacter luteus TaxID=1581420 RepID=A0A0G9MYW9_9SPHN|nr:hypothetical protein AAW00_00025 [Aurantiacibacter luteus]
MTVQGEALVVANAASAEARNAEIPFAAGALGTMAPFRAIAAGSSAYTTALGCLTEAIYYEAANESVRGKRGVAQVILNRVRHPAYPSSVCGVVYQGYTDAVCQFSYTCDGSLARRPMDRQWRESREVAAAALGGYVETSVGTATNYHADYVVPYWAFTLDKVVQEGRHIFYRLPGGAGRPMAFAARWTGREFHPSFNPARFAAMAEAEALAEEGLSVEPSAAAAVVRDVTDRRADNDVGGRMDVSAGTGWQLSIPDPVNASNGYRAALREQGDGAAPATDR